MIVVIREWTEKTRSLKRSHRLVRKLQYSWNIPLKTTTASEHKLSGYRSTTSNFTFPSVELKFTTTKNMRNEIFCARTLFFYFVAGCARERLRCRNCHTFVTIVTRVCLPLTECRKSSSFSRDSLVIFFILVLDVRDMQMEIINFISRELEFLYVIWWVCYSVRHCGA